MRAFLPCLGFEEGVSFFLNSYGGGRNLKAASVQELRGWKRPEVRRFIIQRDQEQFDDCMEVKRSIEDWVREKCRKQSEQLRVRISCRELEAWYLGDLDALWQAYPDAPAKERRRIEKYRDAPDTTREKPSDILRGVAGKNTSFPKTNAAPEMGDILGRKCAESASYYAKRSAKRNTSPSFRCFARTMVETLRELR